MAGRSRETTAARNDPSGARAVGTARDTVIDARASYDIEDEMPEKSVQKPAQLIERLEPMKTDSISVQDVAVEKTPEQRYDVGYRIQVFASADRGAAERIRERIVAESSMNAYIEMRMVFTKCARGISPSARTPLRPE